MVSRGFTLIELLVVMAIIGLISSIIIASLGTSRAKGDDAAIKEEMHAMAQEAELYYYNPALGNNTYGAGTNSCTGGMFAADNNIVKGLLAISAANGAPVGDVNGSKCAVPVGGAVYAMTAKLITPGLALPWWCIDSSGSNKAEAGSNFTGGGLCQ